MATPDIQEDNGAATVAKRQALIKRATLLGFDCCCILIAYAVAVHVLDPGVIITFWDKAILQIPYLVIFLVLWITASLDQHVFVSWDNEDLGKYVVHVTKAVADSLIISTVAMALFSNQGVSRQFLLVFAVGTFASVLAIRIAARAGLWGTRLRGLNIRRAVIVGANDRSERLLKLLTTREYHGYRVVGLLDDDAQRAKSMTEKYSVAYLGALSDFETCVENHAIDEIFVALPIRSSYSAIQDLAEYCETKSLGLRLVAELFPLRIASNRLMYAENIPLLSLSAIPEEQLRLAIKRAIDFAVATILLILLAIPLAMVAIIIKLDSRGPIFFAQERVGQNQRRFPMLKFRSMVRDAEKQRDELESKNEADGPVFKIRDDPRITRVGAFIRKFSIDEFPQLINVWLGQMSLVGPRPPIASEVAQYSWEQRRRLSVKPGMTGLWQVSGRSDVGFKEWVELDLKYIDSWSLRSDFVILLKTFRAVLQGRGAA